MLSSVARKLKQRVSTLPKPPAPPTGHVPPEQRLVIFMGTTRLRFRMRGLLWAPGPYEPRMYDKVLPFTTSDTELIAARKQAARDFLKIRPSRASATGAAFIAAGGPPRKDEPPALVKALLAARKKQPYDVIRTETRSAIEAFRPTKRQYKTVDGSFIALPPPPPPLPALRGGVSNYQKEGGSACMREAWR